MTREITIYTPCSYDEYGVYPLKEASSFTDRDKAIDCIMINLTDAIGDYIPKEECDEIIKSLRAENYADLDELKYSIVVSTLLVED